MSDTVIVPGTADVLFREQHQKVLPITERPLCCQYARVCALNSLWVLPVSLRPSQEKV